MPAQNTYAFPKDSKAWQAAVDAVADLLPAGANKSIQVLKQLPVFAVILVIDKDAIESLEGQSVDDVVSSWVATQNGWSVSAVADDEVAKAFANRIDATEPLAEVSVHRYLLIADDSKQMNIDKREAAAHIIDEQLTVHVKKLLRPKPNYNFKVDSSGHVAGFEPGRVAKRNYVDVHILSVAQMLRRHKLACFDMDSTLIEQEVIVELARMCGLEEKVAEITERAMRGELDFNQSFAQRVALLDGVSEDVVGEIISNRISFSPGAFAVIRALKAKGCRTVLVSGGFMPFAKYVAETLGIDEYYANPLITYGGKLTGEIDDNIIDGKAKARIVARIADEMTIDMEEVVCVGDGANDLPMMSISDIGVAYKAKPIVQVKADAAINVTGLEGVLYAMGHKFEKAPSLF